MKCQVGTSSHPTLLWSLTCPHSSLPEPSTPCAATTRWCRDRLNVCTVPSSARAVEWAHHPARLVQENGMTAQPGALWPGGFTPRDVRDSSVRSGIFRVLPESWGLMLAERSEFGIIMRSSVGFWLSGSGAEKGKRRGSLAPRRGSGMIARARPAGAQRRRAGALGRCLATPSLSFPEFCFFQASSLGKTKLGKREVFILGCLPRAALRLPWAGMLRAFSAYSVGKRDSQA